MEKRGNFSFSFSYTYGGSLAAMACFLSEEEAVAWVFFPGFGALFYRVTNFETQAIPLKDLILSQITLNLKGK